MTLVHQLTYARKAGTPPEVVVANMSEKFHNPPFGSFGRETILRSGRSTSEADPQLAKLREAWERFDKITASLSSVVHVRETYSLALAVVSSIGYSKEDLERFVISLHSLVPPASEKETPFLPKAGFFISALINLGTSDSYTLQTPSDIRLICLGYRNTKTLIIYGDVGDNTGEAMEGGSLTVYGSTGDFTGAFMSGGTLTVEGSVGRLSRYRMSGGVLRINGKCEYASDDVRGSQISIRGALVFTCSRPPSHIVSEVV